MVRFPFGDLIGPAGCLALVAGMASLRAASPQQELASFARINPAPVERLLEQPEGTQVTLDVPFVLAAETLAAFPRAPLDLVAELAGESIDAGTRSAPVSIPPQVTDFAEIRLDRVQGADRALWEACVSGRPNASLNLALRHESLLNEHARGGGSEAALAAAWQRVMLDQATRFREKGLEGLLPYGTPTVHLSGVFARILRSRSPLAHRFYHLAEFVARGHTPDPAGRSISYRWLESVRGGQTVFSLVTFVATPTESGFRLLEAEYQVSSGYLGRFSFSEAWSVGEQMPRTLLWRGDFVVLEAAQDLRGMERVAAGKVLLRETLDRVRAFQVRLGPDRR